MGLRLSIACDGERCDETCGFTLLELLVDVSQAYRRLTSEGWEFRRARNKPQLRALCPNCVRKFRPLAKVQPCPQ